MVMSVSAEDNNSIDGLNITDNLTQASDVAKLENKTVMLMFSQENCYYCDVFEQETLTNPEVQKLLNESYVIVDVDINDQPEIASKYQVFGTPTVIVLYDNGDEHHKIEGYVPSDVFIDALKEF